MLDRFKDAPYQSAGVTELFILLDQMLRRTNPDIESAELVARGIRSRVRRDGLALSEREHALLVCLIGVGGAEVPTQPME